MNNDTDIIGFCTFVNDTGMRRYGCRGYGKRHDALYAWLDTIEIGPTSSDFPWSYWGFVNADDEQYFLQHIAKEDDWLYRE